MDAPLSRNLLVELMHGYGKPRAQWRVGVELERHVLGPDGWPAPYAGDHGIRWLMEQLIPEGWAPKFEGENPIALTRGMASVTLEPGGQFELAGSPFHRLADVIDEANTFARDVARHLAPTPYRQVALGFTPFARVADIGWVPKGRYAIMRDHMSLAGSHGHHMMKGTAATQASFDFSDEVDCAAKVQLAIRTAPLVTAMFANSPLEEGRSNGWKSFRGFIWTRTDPARTGFPEAATSFSFERWVDYLLDVPMMFTRTDGTWRPAHGRTFRSWMQHGDDHGRQPTLQDWDLHQTSVFPEVRVKHLIEVRMGDCVAGSEIAAFSALFKGLLYGAAGTDEALALCQAYDAEGTQVERFLSACRGGLSGQHAGRTMSAWAVDLVELARRGLSAIAPEEAQLLDPLLARVARAETPADLLLDRLGEDRSPSAVIAATSPLD